MKTSITYEQSSYGKGIEPTASPLKSSPKDILTATTFSLWRPLLVVAVQISLLKWMHNTIFSSGPHDLIVSLSVPVSTTILYLSFVTYGLYRLKNKISTNKISLSSQQPVTLSMYSDSDLRPWMLSYNVYQCLLNGYVVLELIREVYLNPNFTSIWGNSIIHGDEGKKISFLLLVHSQNKIIELSDTIFMIVRGKTNQVTTLHVWHHMLLLWSWYSVVRYACNGDAYFGAVTNSITHVLIYLYYTMTTFGYETTHWKKYLTSLQMVQFVVCGIHACYCLYAENYPSHLCWLNIFVQINMMVLFNSFYKRKYGTTTSTSSTVVQEEKKEKKQEKTESTESTESTTSTAAVSTPTTTLPTYTMQDVKLRNGSSSEHWCISGNQILNFSKFIATHPGGNCIVLASGIDATILLHTYHPNGIPKNVFNSLIIGKLASKNKSYYDWSSEFYTVLRTRVSKRLRELKKPRRGSYEIWIKAIVLLIIFWSSLISMCLSETYMYSLISSIIMGGTASFIGTCIQHDGSHGAFSTSSWLNTCAGWTLDMIGASAFTWEIQHMLGHHPYTNLISTENEAKKINSENNYVSGQSQESDPDIFSSFPFMRMHPSHNRLWYHKYQYMYGPLLFSMMTLMKVFQQDFEMYNNKNLYHISASARYGNNDKKDTAAAATNSTIVLNRIRFVCMKILSMIYMLILPMYYQGVVYGLLLFTIGHLVCGEMLAMMFIVNHVIEGVAFVKEEILPTNIYGILPSQKESDENELKGSTSVLKFKKGIPANDWAAVQCQTSVNWSSGSWFWNHFSGGLNHQIEHHLFPSICHTNYYYIQDIVEDTCREYNIPYRSESNLFVAIKKMLLHLKIMGEHDSHESFYVDELH